MLAQGNDFNNWLKTSKADRRKVLKLNYTMPLGEGVVSLPDGGGEVNLSKELGRGAFGTVYEGMDQNRRQVAVKRIGKKFGQSASREAIRNQCIKNSIDHEKVMRVFDVKTHWDSMWIIMEFCDVGDLEDFFNTRIDIAFEDFTIVRFMKDIAEGLAFLHSKNIAHRDIKPTNILVKSTHDQDISVVAKLADFGLSRLLDPNRASAKYTDAGTIMFKAPEFFEGKHNKDGGGEETQVTLHYDSKVDVYSMALTFVAMLQAEPPKSQTERKSKLKLKPRSRSIRRTSEVDMVFGELAMKRKVDAMVYCERDGVPSETGRCLILQDMLRTSPHRRISASDASEKISEHYASVVGERNQTNETARSSLFVEFAESRPRKKRAHTVADFRAPKNYTPPKWLRKLFKRDRSTDKVSLLSNADL